MKLFSVFMLILTTSHAYSVCPKVENSIESTCQDLAETVVANCAKDFDLEAKDKKQNFKLRIGRINATSVYIRNSKPPP